MNNLRYRKTTQISLQVLLGRGLCPPSAFFKLKMVHCYIVMLHSFPQYQSEHDGHLHFVPFTQTQRMVFKAFMLQVSDKETFVRNEIPVTFL